MFKTSSYALTVALITHAGTRANAACDGVVSSFKGECNLANFQGNLVGDCTMDVLFPGVAATDYGAEVDALCKYDAPVQVSDRADLLQRCFFH